MNNILKSYKLKYYQKIGKIMILLSPDFKDGDFLDEKYAARLSPAGGTQSFFRYIGLRHDCTARRFRWSMKT